MGKFTGIKSRTEVTSGSGEGRLSCCLMDVKFQCRMIVFCRWMVVMFPQQCECQWIVCLKWIKWQSYVCVLYHIF